MRGTGSVARPPVSVARRVLGPSRRRHARRSLARTRGRLQTAASRQRALSSRTKRSSPVTLDTFWPVVRTGYARQTGRGAERILFASLTCAPLANTAMPSAPAVYHPTIPSTTYVSAKRVTMAMERSAVRVSVRAVKIHGRMDLATIPATISGFRAPVSRCGTECRAWNSMPH